MFQWGNCIQNVPNKLISSLFSQKEEGKYCDIMLKFGQVEFKAHACVVASFSTFVDNRYTSEEVMLPEFNAGPNHLFEIDVPLNQPNFSCQSCASKVIDFMYVGKIQIDDEHLQHIKVVSEGLEVSELIKICRKHSNKQEERKKKCTEDELSALSSEPTTTGQAAVEVTLPPPNPEEELSPSLPSPQKLHEMNQVSTFCSDLITETVLDDVPDENEWRGIKCPKCDLVVMCLAKYQQHCSSHLGKTYTMCYVCHYASIRVPDVIKHLQEKNHGEKICSLCLLECPSSQSLKEHLQLHDQPQPFFCLTCNTRFQTRTALNSHIVRHTNETPFVCKECGRGFKWKHGLQSHMVTHSKLKPFLCDQCGFSTAHLKSFIDHKTMHSGEKFKCPKPDCQFESVRKESVKHHLMTHSKQKPYQCEVCGQAFSQSKNLRRHAASHNPSVGPESCPLCPYQTSRSDKFKAHFKRFHKDGERINIKKASKRKSSLPSGSVSLKIRESERLTTSDSATSGNPYEGTIVSSSLMVLSKSNDNNGKESEKQPLNVSSLNTVGETIPKEAGDVSFGVNHPEGGSLLGPDCLHIDSKSCNGESVVLGGDSSRMPFDQPKFASGQSSLPLLGPSKASESNLEEAKSDNTAVITVLSNPLTEKSFFQSSSLIDLNFFSSLYSNGKERGEDENSISAPSTNLTATASQLVSLDNQTSSSEVEESWTKCSPTLHFEMIHEAESAVNCDDKRSSVINFTLTSGTTNNHSFTASEILKTSDQKDSDTVLMYPQLSLQSLQPDPQNDGFLVMEEHIMHSEEDNPKGPQTINNQIYILDANNVISSEIYVIRDESFLFMDTNNVIVQTSSEQSFDKISGEGLSSSLNISPTASNETQTELINPQNLVPISNIEDFKSTASENDASTFNETFL